MRKIAKPNSSMATPADLREILNVSAGANLAMMD